MDLAASLILGIVYVAAPEPIGAETVRQGIRGGLVPSLAAQTGSVIGLVLYVLLALWGAGLLATGAVWQMVAGVAVIHAHYQGAKEQFSNEKLYLSS